VKLVDSESQTDLEVSFDTSASQTEAPVRQTSRGTQWDIDSKSVGISCKIVPAVKEKCIQATVGVKNQGVSVNTETQSVSTQCDKGVKRVKKLDVGVSCIQSPSDTSRHVQTDVIKLVGVETNTESVRVTNVATEMLFDELKYDWGDIMDNELGDAGSRVECGADSNHTQTRRVGKAGLMDLLRNLGVQQTPMDQYGKNINSSLRNDQVRGVIKCGDVGDYLAVLDDLCIQISKMDKGYSAESYVKLYGDFWGLMCSDGESTVFSMMAPDSACYKDCINAVWLQLPKTLNRIRSRHSLGCPRGYGRHDGGYGDYGNPSGGRGHGYSRKYQSSGYGGYSSEYGGNLDRSWRTYKN
jgi:hypothetical protein